MTTNKTFSKLAALVSSVILFLCSWGAARGDQAATVAVGSAVTFSVTADGTSPFTYQWRKAGIDISGATGATYTIGSVRTTDVGNYSVLVANSAGSTVSDTGTITVQSVAITTQPVGQSVAVGSSVTFTAAASGSPTPTYQWNKTGVSISGATNSSLTLSNVQLADAGTYTMVATNSAGTATSAGAILSVSNLATAPAITSQPVGQTVTAGNSATFTAAASGSPAPTYQWKFGGVAVAGATSSSLTLTNVQATVAGTYTVVATNSAGSATSSGATLTVSNLATAPAIITQPVSQSVTVGGSVIFAAAASGSPAPTYQWKLSGAAISGATGSSLTLTNVQSTAAGTYTVVATNSAGSATSSGAALTVSNIATAPSISTQPRAVTVTAGSAASFSVTAGGTAPLSYQWQKGGAAILGATGTTYSIANAQTGDAGNYTVMVSNSVGSVTSSAAALTVNAAAAAPSILIQPQSVTVTTGGAVNFSVTASGTAPLSYQWQKGGAAILGATSATYSIASAQTGDAGNYTVMVSNTAGSLTSATATLTVNPAVVAPTITNQPQTLTVTPGSVAAFSITATGTETLSYQWKKGGINIAGGTGATYSIASAQAGDAGDYTVMVTNSVGSVTSNAASLTVNAVVVAPSFTTQPQGLTITAGASASFSVTANGTAPLSYQWRVDGAAIAGATNATYAIANAQAGNAGNYTVVVNNAAGSVTSTIASLTVNPAPSATTAPTFTSQPSSQTVATGHSVSIHAVASGSPAPGYLWQVSTNRGSSWTNLSDNANYSGTATSTLTVNNATAEMSGSYRLTASNSAGSATSNSMTLTVATPAIPGPSGLAVDAAGKLYISDSSNNTIQVVSTAGESTVLAGAAGQQGSSDGAGAAALFRQPGGVVLDAAGNLYVADTGNSMIRKISVNGVVTTVAGSTANQGYRDGSGTAAWFNSPTGIALDGAGNLYVTDTGNSVIRKIDVNGNVTTLAGTAGSKGGADGTGTAARFNQPTGITVDASGTIFVADTFNQTIRRITAGGVVTTWVGLQGVSGVDDGVGTGALFNQPTGISVDASGYFCVADAGNSTIRLIAPNGTVVTVAGLPNIAGFKDGSGSEAWFNQPKDLRWDAAGNIYVTDNGNAAIRKITPAGVVTTMTIVQSSSNSSPSTTPPVSTPSTPSPSTSTPVSGSGGGGGAMETWFVAMLLAWVALYLLRIFASKTGIPPTCQASGRKGVVFSGFRMF